jgi:hypothetical protein
MNIPARAVVFWRRQRGCVGEVGIIPRVCRWWDAGPGQKSNLPGGEPDLSVARRILYRGRDAPAEGHPVVSFAKEVAKDRCRRQTKLGKASQNIGPQVSLSLRAGARGNRRFQFFNSHFFCPTFLASLLRTSARQAVQVCIISECRGSRLVPVPQAPRTRPARPARNASDASRQSCRFSLHTSKADLLRPARVSSSLGEHSF